MIGPIIPRGGLNIVVDPINKRSLKKDQIYINVNRVSKSSNSLISKPSPIRNKEPSSVRPSILIDGDLINNDKSDSYTISLWVKIDDFPYREFDGRQIRSKRSAITRINYDFNDETKQRNFIEFGAMLPYYKLSDRKSVTYPYKTPFSPDDPSGYYNLPVSFGAALKIGKKSYTFYTDYKFKMKTWYLLSFEIQKSFVFERYERYESGKIKKRMTTDYFQRNIKSNKTVYNDNKLVKKEDFLNQENGLLKMKTKFYVNDKAQPIVIAPNIIWAGRDGRRGKFYCSAHPGFKNSFNQDLTSSDFMTRYFKNKLKDQFGENINKGIFSGYNDPYLAGRYEFIDLNNTYNIQMAPIKDTERQQLSKSDSNLYKLNNNISFGQFNIYNRKFNKRIYNQFKMKY